MIKNIYNRLFKENYFRNLDELLHDFDDFEEFPLITRYAVMDAFEPDILDADRSRFLMFSAQYLLQNVNLLWSKRRQSLAGEFFAAITLIDPHEELAEIGYVIPHLFVSRKSTIHPFIDPRDAFTFPPEDPVLRELSGTDMEHRNTCYRSITTAGNDRIERYYFIPKTGTST